MTKHSAHRRVNARYPTCVWSGEAVIPHHLVPRGDGGPCARVGSACPGETSESPPCAARQDGAPLAQPRGFHSVLHQRWHRHSAFAFARLRRNWAVLTDYRAPVSAANTRRGLSLSPTNSGCVVIFLRRASPKAPSRRTLRLPPESPIPPERRHQRGLDGQLPCHRVNPSPITSILRPSRPLKALGSRSRTWGHLRASLPTHLGCGTLKKKPSLSQNPLPQSTLHDDGHKWLSRQPHRKVREDKGKGKRRRLHSRMRKGWASILVIRIIVMHEEENEREEEEQ